MGEIKASELRIGNLVYYNGNHKEVGTITGLNSAVSKQCFIYLNNRVNNTLDLEMIEPIPLTEQWLLDFGAYQESLISEKDSLLIDVTENISIGWCGYLFLLIEGMIIQINDANSIYIHQLQNLYFSLKNTELTLKK